MSIKRARQIQQTQRRKPPWLRWLQQITELAGYMRQRYAPGKAAWRDLPEAVARVRALR